MRTTKWSLLAVTVTGALLTLATAGSATADVPEGWDPDPKKVNLLHAVLVLGGIPLALAIVIVIAVYVPSLIRGESLAPGAPTIENQWLGGPRPGAKELAPPDSPTSEAGGASARW